MAAELILAGVDVHEIYRRVYEGVPYGKLALLARGLANVQRYDGGKLTATALSAKDFTDSGAEESYSEGVIDGPVLPGTAVAALVRPTASEMSTAMGLHRDARCLCAPAMSVDVSAIARAQGGGGHRQAAGFSTAMDWEEIVAFLREEVQQRQLRRCSARLRRRSHPLRQACRNHLA